MPKRIILVIGAHPADPVDLAGGAVSIHSDAGDEVHLACLTDGLFSHTSSGMELSVMGKRREFQQAAREVGVPSNQCWFTGLVDEPLIVNQLVVRELAETIRKLRPGIVITHHPNEYAHWDHHECGEAVCRAVKAAVKLPPETCGGAEPHAVPLLLFFAVQFRPEVARVGAVPQPPDVLVDLPVPVVKRKIEAMKCFASQGHNDEGKMWERMQSFESEMGRADGLRFSEGFILGNPLKVDLLPATKDVSFYKGKENNRNV